MAELRSRAWFWNLLTIVLVAGCTFGVTLLLMNIKERKTEGQQYYFPVVELDDSVVDPAEWGKNFPRQYDSYRRTVDQTRTTHGGSDGLPPSKLEADPRLVKLFSGYAFAVDYREKRGHAFMLADQKGTERVKQFRQKGACLHCHASVIPAYIAAGTGDNRGEKIASGFAEVCPIPLEDAWGKVKHPVACIDCHEPKTMQLRVERPGFVNGIRALARGDAPVPHLPSIERWRKGNRKQEYDVNADASRQEMRSFVCGQCHVEYYFRGEQKLVTYPWHRGLKADDIEAYYDRDAGGYKDYTHGVGADGKETKEGGTKAPILKAQHPEFEMWSQGIHARSGVACADCHMPYVREGAIKVSDHQVRSPVLMVNRACQTCHRWPEEEGKARVAVIQDRTRKLMGRAEDAVVALIDTVKQAREKKLSDKELGEVLLLHRKAQWRVDFVNAENSMGFHAPQEAARLLGEAIDYARQGEAKALRLMQK